MPAQIGALVLATCGVQLAVGFFGTFISLRVPLEDFSATMSALVLSGYFAGYTIGAICSARIIERVGHIRAYAALAGLAVVTNKRHWLCFPPAWNATVVNSFGSPPADWPGIASISSSRDKIVPSKSKRCEQQGADANRHN